ncbi:MAG TPA: hypothetical protein VLX56_02385 [Nitrososphaerales archaeon]|nr:hypothetical protein [Nitrososphaerales archaeon]
MSSSSSANYSSVYLFLGILLLLVIRRFSRVIRGTKVSTSRTIIFAAYYLAFAALLIAVSVVSGGVSPEYLALYAVVGAVGVYGSYAFSDRRIGFWKDADGSIWYKGAVVVYVIYIVGLMARIAIDLAFIGPQIFTFAPTPSSSLTPTAVDAGMVTDLLLAFGSGLLTGRNLRVMKRYNRIRAGQEQVGETPPDIPLI